MVKNLIRYSQELVLALAWLAFGFLGSNAPLVEVLDQTYPSLEPLFHGAFVLAGLFMLVAVVRPVLMLPAWLFSTFVSLSALILSVGVDDPSNDELYFVTWALFIVLGVAQSARHYMDAGGQGGD